MAKETKQSEDKPKRRLRPSSETVRQRSENGAESSRRAIDKTDRRAAKPVYAIFRPIAWIFRHIIPRFLRNAFRELRQVTWPNRRQSRQLTTAVIIFSLVFGAFVSLLDYGISQLFKKVVLHQ